MVSASMLLSMANSCNGRLTAFSPLIFRSLMAFEADGFSRRGVPSPQCGGDPRGF